MNYNMNGPPGGANTKVDQSNYDLIFKDIIVSSDKRNVNQYPKASSYSVDLNINFNQIYKAELIEVYIPAATDPAVNIPANQNIFYFVYESVGYQIIVKAGTYFSPASVADEIGRLITLITPPIPVGMIYDKNLNRYNFYCDFGSLSIDITSPNNIASSMRYSAVNSASPGYPLPLFGGPKNIFQDSNKNLYVGVATTFGSVGLNDDPYYSNCILSNVVLTDCRIYLSLGKLDGDTVSQVANYNPLVSNIPAIFCQVPNNSYISSANVKTLLSQPNVYSSVQFYNPTINGVNKLDIRWYSEDGDILDILEHCFTIRVYYFQKRSVVSDISTQVLNGASGTDNSVFQRRNY